jgi:hypothetical protein
MQTSEGRGIQSVPSWFAVVFAIASAIASGGVAWGATNSKNVEQDRRLDSLEAAVSRITDIRESVARIEGKLDRRP